VPVAAASISLPDRFPIINKEQFVALLRNIGNNAIGAAFNIALCSMSPDLCDLLKYLQDQVAKMNQLNINSCQAAEGIVAAAGSLLTDRTQEKEGKTAGANLNLFGDVFESWDEWKKNRASAKNIRTAARNASSGYRELFEPGNIVWRALSRVAGVTDETRELLMSLTGTILITPPGEHGDEKAKWTYLPGGKLTFRQFVGDGGMATVNLAGLKCGADTDECLSPTFSDSAFTVPPFSRQVRTRIAAMRDKILHRDPSGQSSLDTALIGSSSLPVWKMLSVSSSIPGGDRITEDYAQLIAVDVAYAYFTESREDAAPRPPERNRQERSGCRRGGRDPPDPTHRNRTGSSGPVACRVPEGPAGGRALALAAAPAPESQRRPADQPLPVDAGLQPLSQAKAGMYEVYAYWNVAELEAMFNAVAALMGSGDYLGLLRTMAIVGILVVVLATLTGRERLDGMWKWLFFLAIFQALLLVPKVTVTIVDRTGNEPPRAVANVPIGLGIFAHAMSKVGDWLTGAFETVFALPDDVKFRKNGTLFGHRVLAERLAIKSGSPVLTSNLLEFYRECVAPDIATGAIRAKEDLLEVNDIWGSLHGRTNPSRLVTLRDTADPSLLSTIGCDAAYEILTRQIAAEASRQVTLLGSRLYPRMTSADAGIAIAGALATSTNYLLGVSAAAQDTVKQAIVANFLIDAQYLLPAQLGDAASAQTNLGMAQSLRSTSDSYKLMARIAESTMPKVRNAIEMVQYAIFPVFLLFVVISGHQAFLVIRAYATSLFWIQLWAPLYAVMNFIITLVFEKPVHEWQCGQRPFDRADEFLEYRHRERPGDCRDAGHLDPGHRGRHRERW
jgi:hypothetical protein